MENGASLQDIMNRMANRLDDVLPETFAHLPEDRDWPFIHLYLQSDPLLAQLYKQYCDARERLTALRKEFGRDAAMVTIAGDMKDSAHSAVETRLIELKENKQAQRAAVPVATARMKHKTEKQKSETSFGNAIALLLWAQQVIATGRLPLPAVKRQFAMVS